MNYDIEGAKSKLSNQHFAPDFDETTLKSFTKNSIETELFGKINLICLSKLLLPGISLSVRLNLASPEFYIQENVVDTATTSELKILSAKLYIKHVTPSNDIILSHERLLASGRT